VADVYTVVLAASGVYVAVNVAEPVASVSAGTVIVALPLASVVDAEE
jgi:hypothetical protein